jgi:hypothetical protein
MTIGIDNLGDRVRELYQERWDARLVKVDRMFAKLMIVQWVFAVLVAWFLSPYAWSGKTRVIHTHVYVAVLMGGAITLLPVILARYRAGSPLTRHVIAMSQMLMSALLSARGAVAGVGVRDHEPGVVALPRARLLGGVRGRDSDLGMRDWAPLRMAAQQQAAVEQLTELEQLKTAALEMALAELGASA